MSGCGEADPGEREADCKLTDYLVQEILDLEKEIRDLRDQNEKLKQELAEIKPEYRRVKDFIYENRCADSTLIALHAMTRDKI